MQELSKYRKKKKQKKPPYKTTKTKLKTNQKSPEKPHVNFLLQKQDHD